MSLSSLSVCRNEIAKHHGTALEPNRLGSISVPPLDFCVMLGTLLHPVLLQSCKTKHLSNLPKMVIMRIKSSCPCKVLGIFWKLWLSQRVLRAFRDIAHLLTCRLLPRIQSATNRYSGSGGGSRDFSHSTLLRQVHPRSPVSPVLVHFPLLR